MSRNLQMDDSPWLVDAAVERMRLFLELKSLPRVFEWGAGGSTLWFAKRAVFVTSVEHTLEYAERVNALLGDSPASVTWIPEGEHYFSVINDFSWTFDLILVDGILRNECIAAAIPHLLTDGLLVIDNTERADEYAEGLALVKDWQREDYIGDWTTSIFIKP